MTPVDLVIVEGFKRFPHPKLEVHRRERGTPLLADEDPTIVAARHRRAASPSCALPQFGLDDVPAIAALHPRPPRHSRRRHEPRSPRTASPMAATGSRCAPPMPCCASGSRRSSGIEEVALAEAAGRCLAAPLVSPRDVPAFDNAAVDGFAFAFQPGMREAGRAPDAWSPGRAAAGHPFAGALPPGAALRVLTGAVMPARHRHRGPAGGGRAADGDASPSRAA